MTLRQLQYFLKVLELKSFSKAAERLRVAQPALGFQVRKLEEELGLKLFDRHSRGVTPTEAGLVLRDHALVILRQVERARLSLTDLAGPPRGKVAVGVTSTINLVLATRLVERCRESCPNISLSIVEGMSEDLVQWLESDRIDLAFTYNPGNSRGLVYEPLLTEDLCLVQIAREAPRDRTTARLAEIATLPMVLPSRSSGLRGIVDDAATRSGIEYEVVLEIDSVAAIKEMVLNAIGTTVLPLGAVKREVDEGRLVARRLEKPALSRRMFLTYSAQRPASSAQSAIEEVMRQVVKENLAIGTWAWRPAEVPQPLQG